MIKRKQKEKKMYVFSNGALNESKSWWHLMKWWHFCHKRFLFQMTAVVLNFLFNKNT